MGQLASNLGNLGNIMEAAPKDLSGSEWATRLGAGAIKGAGQGFSNYQNQNAAMRQGGGGAQIPIAPQPQVQLPMGMPDVQRPKNPYFYGYGGGQ